MKKLDLGTFGVEEMNEVELKMVEGGGFFDRAYDWIVNAFEDACGFVGI